MTDGDALLSAIHAAPEDDAPRLVFADWLDETGDSERAEFMRIQVAMRREYEGHGRTDRLEELFVRSRTLFYQPWSEAARSVFGRGVARYSRGFPKAFRTRTLAATFLAMMPQLRSWLGPGIRVHLYEGAGGWKDLATACEARWIWRLQLDGAVTDADLADLCASPYWGSLRELHASGHGLTNKGALAIQRAVSLCGLESLDLSGNRIGRRGAIALANAPHLTTLRNLDLSRNHLDDQAVMALLESPFLTQLQSLNLWSNEYTHAVTPAIEARFRDPLNPPRPS